MSPNDEQSPRRPRIEMAESAASPEEAAAVIAAIEHFLADTAPPLASAVPAVNPWLRAALYEGAGLSAESPAPWLEAWGDGEPWGSR